MLSLSNSFISRISPKIIAKDKPMAILALALIIIGGIIALFGSIWFYYEAFKTSILWGLGCLIVPFVALIYLITHLEESAKPFGISLLGGLMIIGGAFLTGA